MEPAETSKEAQAGPEELYELIRRHKESIFPKEHFGKLPAILEGIILAESSSRASGDASIGVHCRSPTVAVRAA